MPPRKDMKNTPAALKRIGDYVEVGSNERLEGERVDIDEVLGEDIELHDFIFIKSSKFADEKGDGTKKDSEFAVIQFKLPGSDDLKTTSCGGKVVVAALKEMPKQYLPILVRITRVKAKTGGGRYYNIE